MPITNKTRQPYIMVAPNGAYKQAHDHPNIPLTNEAIALSARACFDAGAKGIHAHCRDKHGRHILNVNKARDLIEQIQSYAPKMRIQITTEAAKRYRREAQIQFAQDLGHNDYSVALREIAPFDQDIEPARAFYLHCEQHHIRLQHILYEYNDIDRFERLCHEGIIRPHHQKLEILLVIGRYAHGYNSDPESTLEMIAHARSIEAPAPLSIMVCAFGQSETACLTQAAKAGCDCRIGFENNWLNQDGMVARDNAERIRDLRSALKIT